MKKLLIGALVAGQLLTAAQPALAAAPGADEQARMGAFGGVRIRLPLDGDARQRRLTAGLTLAPTMHARTPEGALRLRIGEGLELGAQGREPVRLSIGGRDFRRLSAQQDAEDDGGGVPTWVWVAGGIIVATAGGLLILIDSVNDSSD